jgi:2-(3-amino-3-carboxypropyl)histidine synthase
MKQNIRELQEKYELEIEEIVKQIKKQKSKKVLIQLPEGLKPYALAIEAELKKQLGKNSCEFFIWLDSCFGACDMPLETEKLGIDTIIQFGHSEFIRQK